MRSKSNLAIFVCLILLAVASTSNYLNFYSKFLPRDFDQTVSLLQFYEAYYSWKDGASPFYDFITSLLKLQTMKGGLTQDFGLLLSIFLGPSRLSLWLPNFGALVLFLFVIYNYASRSMSKEAALIVATLSLLGPTVCTTYSSAGGLYDLRWDFVGIMMFGCFLVSLWKLINQYSKINLAIAVTFSIIAIDARNINMAFVGLTIFGVCLVFLLLLISKSLRSYALAQIKTMLILGTIVLIFYAAFAITHWSELSSYYLDRTLPGRALSDEKMIRLKQFGVEDGLLKFYIQTAYVFYKPYVVYPALILILFWTYWWASLRKLLALDTVSGKTDFVEEQFKWRIEGIVIAIVSSLSVLVSASLYAPYQVVVSYLFGACSFLMICFAPPMKQKSGNILLWIILVTLFFLAVVRISSVQSWGKSELKFESNARQLFQSVLSNSPGGGRISIYVVDETFLPENFMIWLYENGNRRLVDKFSATSIDISPLSPTEYDRQLSESDFVFRWEKPPSKITFPSEEQSIGEFGNMMWAHHSSQFELLKNIQYKGGILGVYVRRVRAAEIIAPLGLEGDKKFWLGDEHAHLSIVNRANFILQVRISAALGLGPIIPQGSQVNLCVTSVNSVLNCYPVSSKNDGFEIVVPADPGTNDFELSVVHEADMKFIPFPGDSRGLLLRVSNLRISEVGQ